jgi:hypothetical protein
MEPEENLPKVPVNDPLMADRIPNDGLVESPEVTAAFEELERARRLEQASNRTYRIAPWQIVVMLVVLVSLPFLLMYILNV